MKNLILTLLIISSALIGMENPTPQREIDPILIQAHELKALKSREAVYHEKNSFLDTFMNPVGFKDISDTHLSFPHHKYSEITYKLDWSNAQGLLQEALDLIEVKKEGTFPFWDEFSKNPFTKLNEQQKYEFQLIFFYLFCNNSDISKKETSYQSLVANRSVYRKAFLSSDGDAIRTALKELRVVPYKCFTEKFADLRLQQILENTGVLLQVNRVLKQNQNTGICPVI